MNPEEDIPEPEELPPEGLSIFDDDDNSADVSSEDTAVFMHRDTTGIPTTIEADPSGENEQYGETLINTGRLKHYIRTLGAGQEGTSESEEHTLIADLLEHNAKRTGIKQIPLSDVMKTVTGYIRDEIDEPLRSRAIRVLREILPEFVAKQLLVKANPGTRIDKLEEETRAETAKILGYLSKYL